ncbi:hypothetical protein CHUAL_013941 [Chamberlinius hualienensis]
MNAIFNCGKLGTVYRLSTAGFKEIKCNFGHPTLQISRRSNFHTSSTVLKTDVTTLRNAAFLKKMMKKLNERTAPNKSLIMNPNEPLKDYARGKTSPRRQKVLNNLLLRHISDVLSSGETDLAILGKGIEITRVEVSDDVTSADIFWYCSATENSDEIQKLLSDGAGTLRQILSSLYFMGHVPFLKFVKDPLQENVMDVERILATADMGPEFERPLTYQVMDQINPVSVSDVVKHKIEDKPVEVVEEVKKSPKLRNNIYGLDRDALIRKVQERNRSSNFSFSANASISNRQYVYQDQLDSKQSLEKMTNYIKEQKRLKGLMLKRKPEKLDDANSNNIEIRYEVNELNEIDDDYEEYHK